MLCIPSIQSNYQGIKQSIAGEGDRNVGSNTHLANTAMVSTVVGNIHSTSLTPTNKKESVKKSSGGKSPTYKKQVSESGGLESFRSQLQMSGISGEAAKLISHSRRPGSISNYESTWHKWSSWCRERKFDPFRAPIESVINFLTELFENGLQYRTINLYRSSISAYHER